MWHHMNEFGLEGWGGMMLGMVLLWALLVAAIVMLVRCAMRGQDAGREREKSALDILKERYARGEIEREEFAQKKQDLER